MGGETSRATITSRVAPLSVTPAPPSVIPAQAGIQAISSACARHDAATTQQSRFRAADRSAPAEPPCCVGSCLRRNDGWGAQGIRERAQE